jgi:hypothetical protein
LFANWLIIFSVPTEKLITFNFEKLSLQKGKTKKVASGIREPGSEMVENQEPGSGINIPDPQHWPENCLNG